MARACVYRARDIEFDFWPRRTQKLSRSKGDLLTISGSNAKKERQVTGKSEEKERDRDTEVKRANLIVNFMWYIDTDLLK